MHTYPVINDETHEVELNINVEPGARIHVRRINISGNQITRDEVVRREMRQMEGAWFSNEKVESSKSRLNSYNFV